MWLGEAGPDTAAAAKLVEACDNTPQEDALVAGRILADERGSVGLVELLSRPYWTRAWMFQEVRLAGAAVLHSGRVEIPWPRLRGLDRPTSRRDSGMGDGAAQGAPAPRALHRAARTAPRRGRRARRHEAACRAGPAGQALRARGGVGHGALPGHRVRQARARGVRGLHQETRRGDGEADCRDGRGVAERDVVVAARGREAPVVDARLQSRGPGSPRTRIGTRCTPWRARASTPAGGGCSRDRLRAAARFWRRRGFCSAVSAPSSPLRRSEEGRREVLAGVDLRRIAGRDPSGRTRIQAPLRDSPVRHG